MLTDVFTCDGCQNERAECAHEPADDGDEGSAQREEELLYVLTCPRCGVVLSGVSECSICHAVFFVRSEAADATAPLDDPRLKGKRREGGWLMLPFHGLVKPGAIAPISSEPCVPILVRRLVIADRRTREDFKIHSLVLGRYSVLGVAAGPYSGEVFDPRIPALPFAACRVPAGVPCFLSVENRGMAEQEFYAELWGRELTPTVGGG